MINFRKANAEDLRLYYDWANEEQVRKNSFHQGVISFADHVQWFENKIKSPQALLLVFYLESDSIPIGQVRFESESEHTALIGISVDKIFRGKGYASLMLKMACSYYLSQHPGQVIYAYIKKENEASYVSFVKAGFYKEKEVLYNQTISYKLSFNDPDR